MQRRLIAILAADVVGYSRLMGINEAGTLNTLKAIRRELVAPKIAKFKGRVVKLMGDGLLAEFGSVVDSVECAVEIQSGLFERNKGVDGDQQIHLRIGINLGDIIVEGNDIYGDGVNVAARLESLADSSGICISDMVYQNVKGKLDLSFDDLGFQQVKNISEPIHAYRINLDSPKPAAEPFNGQVSPITEKPSIAVLPFTNMSGDPEQEYFSDGITEDIITELSHFTDLSVIARNSSFVFRDQSVDIVDIGRKLNVHYVLEGSVRKIGSNIRVTAQLIDAGDGTHIWADRYDRNLEDIFAVQDEVVRIISATLIGRVQNAGHELARRKPPSSLQVYDCVVLGLNHFYKWTPKDNKRAKELFEQAVSMDSNYAPAHAWLAEAHFREGLNAWSASLHKSFSLFYEYALNAVTLDDNNSCTHTPFGVANLFHGKHDLARYHLDRALALNPSDTRALVHLARCEALAGNPNKGVEKLTEALQLNPLANYQWYAGQILYISKSYDEAVQVLSSLLSPNALVFAFLAASLAQKGDTTQAAEAASQFVSIVKVLANQSDAPLPESWIGFVTDRYPFKREQDTEHLKDGLKKAGLR